MCLDKRMEEYDIAKGIGILCVILGHILTKESTLRQFIYTFHIPLFFLISGLVMDLDISHCLKTDLNKEKKLFVNYYFFSAIFLLFDLVVRGFIQNKVGVAFFVKSIYQVLTLYGIDVLWFISSLAVGKIITRYVYNRIENKVLTLVITIACMIVAVLLWGNGLEIQDNNWGSYLLYFPVNFVLRTIISAGFIMFGALMKNVVIKIVSQKYSMLFVLFFILNIVIVMASGYNIDYHRIVLDRYGLFLLPAFSGFLGVLGISCAIKKIQLVKMNFQYLAKNSLFLMVTHNYLMIIALAKFIVSKVGGTTETAMYDFSVFLTVMCLELMLCLVIKPIADTMITKLNHL